MAKGTCSVDGCDGRVLARSWCDKHYRRWRRHGDPRAGRRAPSLALCSIANCGRCAYAHGWCKLHYERWLTHGDPQRERPTLAERFWAKVKRGGADECWPWTGARTGNGYGKFQTSIASRVAYEMASGAPVPRGLHVLHACDNPPCCNPAHLSLGTHLDNMADMARKGRTTKGEAHSQSVLTAEKVLALRSSWRDGVTQRSLAARFGIATGTVADIVYRRTWKHI